MIQKSPSKLIFSAVLIILIFIAGYFLWVKKSSAPAVSERAATSTEYRNEQYGFSVTLPKSWTGYSIVTAEWEGFTVGQNGNTPTMHGPLISIRHPQWTAKVPRQDIPIMVFTLEEWNSLLRDKFHVGAAPVNPSRLGFNATYVFALPARYNFAFPMGFEEVNAIIESRPLHAFSSAPLTSDKQILLCGGIPNGGTERVLETSRMFINLPRDVYRDKEHNLQFKTMSGNARAGWISNAGAYGEAFEATPECWSYYYEFNGVGELNLSAKSALAGSSDYSARIIISPTQ